MWKGVAVKVGEANLDGVKGMPDVDYDFDVLASLESAFRAAAAVVEGQRGSRAGYRSGGLIGFQGYYGRHETKPYFSWISCAVSDMIGTCR